MARRLLAEKVRVAATPAILVLFLAAAASPTAAQAQSEQPRSASPSQKSQPQAEPALKAAAPTAQAGGTSAIVMDLSAIESVIGKSVKSSSGEDLGRIVDLLVTTSGQVRAAVIDFGGILGVGSRKIAVDWKALDFASFTKDGTVHLALTRNQVRVSPEYKSGDPVVILQAGKSEDGKPEDSKPATAQPELGKPAKALQGTAPASSKDASPPTDNPAKATPPR